MEAKDPLEGPPFDLRKASVSSPGGHERMGSEGDGGHINPLVPTGFGSKSNCSRSGVAWGTGALWAPQRRGGGGMEAWQLREERRGEHEQGKPPWEGVV